MTEKTQYGLVREWERGDGETSFRVDVVLSSSAPTRRRHIDRLNHFDIAREEKGEGRRLVRGCCNVSKGMNKSRTTPSKSP